MRVSRLAPYDPLRYSFVSYRKILKLSKATLKEDVTGNPKT